ncbi:SSU ribosomal protein S6P modification protein [Volucribacter psittacicida]|uniref:Probable alpha-L-glutamate ligase n=1 Tax=Volucribacter psittacicida TaxID=203482 RepID=A0A4R1FRL0_9PAST|nr:RimK family alpha-L-glutamate ligase [Volucribacter psittacicida]TCJ96202.1 SSU ribosomal protein S6P modification protein [Volucribacter psittacicida]
MKLLMLCREPRLYSCVRLKQAAENSGHQLDILDPNRCLLKLEQNAPHFILYYQEKSDSEPVLLNDYQGIIPRFGTTSTQMGCAVLRHFQAKGTACLNEAKAFLLARDKWQSLQALLQANVPIPTTLLAGNEFSASAAVAQLNEEMILKTLTGAQGIGVMLAEKAQSAVSILETLRHSSVPTLLQQFIKEAQGRDIRCFVIGQQVIASMQRIGKAGEFRANFHRGGSAELVQLSPQEKNMAIQATQALGLDVAGVDLIRTHKGTMVLEVNASPGLELIEQTSHIDIASQMIAYLEKKMAQ